MRRAYAFIIIFCILFSGCSMQELSTAGESFKEYLEQKDNSSSNEAFGKDENNNHQAYSGENIEEAKDSGIAISDNDKSLVKNKKAGDALEILDYKKAADEEMEKVAKDEEERYRIYKSLKFNQYTKVKINDEIYTIGNSSKRYENEEDLKKDFPFISPVKNFDNYKLESIYILLKNPYNLLKNSEIGKVVDGPELSISTIGTISMTYVREDNNDYRVEVSILNDNKPKAYYNNVNRKEVSYNNHNYNIIMTDDESSISVFEFPFEFKGSEAYCYIWKYRLLETERLGNKVMAQYPDWFNNSPAVSVYFVNSIRESIISAFTK